MADEYPTTALLRKIQKWDILKNGIRPLVDLVVENWHWDHYVTLKGNTLKLHTGGWSGNEDIIMALQKNYIFWALCWMKTERGGHYTFKIKEVKNGRSI